MATNVYSAMARRMGYYNSDCLEKLNNITDIKLAKEAYITAIAENDSSEISLVTTRCMMDTGGDRFKIECEVELAIETRLCLEEEMDGIVGYYVSTYE